MNKKLKSFLIWLFLVFSIIIWFAYYLLEWMKTRFYYIWDNIEIMETRFSGHWFIITYKDYSPNFSSGYIKSWFLYNDKIYLAFEDISTDWKLKWVKYILIPVNWDKYPAYYNSKFENKNIVWTVSLESNEPDVFKFKDAEVNDYELTDEDKKVFKELEKSDKVVLWDLEYEIRLEE